MPNLRRSLQNKSTGGLSPTRANGGIAPPPRKVIKALYDYSSPQPEELSFSKGDFFHVVGNEDDEDWYEAYNPVTGARGYVPVTYFQVLEKNGQAGQQQPQRQRNSNQSFEDHSHDSGAFTEPHQYQPQKHSSNGALSPPTSQKSLPKCQPLYGIVLYDFGAERPDELDCKAGDAILVIAQSNEEWYVAKPIGRLGGPGLIPVNFIEIRDMVTGKPINVPEMLRQTGTVLPRVDEWKKQAMEYKANSIPLGRIDANDAPQQVQPQPQPQPAQHVHHHQGHGHAQYAPQLSHAPAAMPSHHQNGGQTIQQIKNKLSRGDLKAQNTRDQSSRRNHSQDLDIGRRLEPSNGRALTPVSMRSFSNDSYDDVKYNTSSTRIIHATVESFHYEEEQYWFSVRVELASGAVRSLFRLYEDFYNFHIALLEEFPVESGRVGDQPRILPFMPIPLQVVTDAVSASRRTDLDAYVADLFRLPSRITQHPLVTDLFALREGDSETQPGGATSSLSPTAIAAAAAAAAAPRPISPGLSRTNPHRESDRRQSPATGSPRTVYTPRSQGSRTYGDESPSGGTSPGTRSQAQFATPLGQTQSSEEMIKVKISFMDDIMAMRIPVSISFKALQQKIFDRLQTDQKGLSYRDDRGDFAIIQNDSDVREAMDRSGGKLMIYVD
ncbi:bud emergence protein 1 [Mortierella sp. NVP85]|nr:bud emergence protein 1 [Mortierella sp. NVP85]